MVGNAFFGLLTDHIEIVQSIIICGLNQKFQIEALKTYAYEKSYIGFGVHKHFFNRIIHARYPKLFSNDIQKTNINIPRSKRYSQKSNLVFEFFIIYMLEFSNNLNKKDNLSSKERDDQEAKIQKFGFLISFIMLPRRTRKVLYYSAKALFPFCKNRELTIIKAYNNLDLLNEIHSEGLKVRDQLTSSLFLKITKIAKEKIRNHYLQKSRDKSSQQI